MKDDALSRMIRDKKGLPVNWRVYLCEAKAGSVKVTGALVRPLTEFEKRMWRDFEWIRPFEMKRTTLVPFETYSALVGRP